MLTVVIRYWAGARAAAGTDTETWTARSIRHALEQAAESRSSVAFANVIRISSVLRDGRVLGPEDLDVELISPVEVEILPPFAGG